MRQKQQSLVPEYARRTPYPARSRTSCSRFPIDASSSMIKIVCIRFPFQCTTPYHASTALNLPGVTHPLPGSIISNISSSPGVRLRLSPRFSGHLSCFDDEIFGVDNASALAFGTEQRKRFQFRFLQKLQTRFGPARGVQYPMPLFQYMFHSNVSSFLLSKLNIT